MGQLTSDREPVIYLTEKTNQVVPLLRKHRGAGGGGTGDGEGDKGKLEQGRRERAGVVSPC